MKPLINKDLLERLTEKARRALPAFNPVLETNYTPEYGIFFFMKMPYTRQGERTLLIANRIITPFEVEDEAILTTYVEEMAGLCVEEIEKQVAG